MSKVAFIVPVYNAESFLHRCVDSILNQSCRNFELILVNDGSPDNCGAICDDYAARDTRVRVIHQENQGVSAARNAGLDWVLENTDCQWVTFVDSDDWIHKDYLKILLRAAEEHQVKLSACNLLWTEKYIEDSQICQESVTVLSAQQAFVQHYDITVTACCKLIHRSILSDIRFPLGVRYEDAAVGHRMVLDTEKMVMCSEKLYYYYFNENSFTRTGWTEARLQVVRVHQQRLDYLRRYGYERAYSRELEAYADRITENLLYLTDLLEKDEKYTVIFEDLRATLREAVREAEALGAFRFDRERLMTYAYASRSDLMWRAARGLQRIWRKVLKR